MLRAGKVLLVVLAVAYGGGGLAALAGADAIRDSWSTIGVNDGLGTVIAVLEVLAAVGLLLGLRWPVLGAAAAGGLVALMIGAVFYHLRAGDTAGVVAPVVLGLLALAAVALTRRAGWRRPAVSAYPAR